MAMSIYYSQTNGTVRSTVESVTEMNDAGESIGRPWDTSDPFFSAKTRDLVKEVSLCYIRQVLVFIGTTGNAICCVVFWKQGLSDRINLLLFWLAVADLFYLVFQLPRIITCYTSDSVLLNNIAVIVNANISRIFVMAGTISGALIVVMSVERCLFVVIPFKARRLLTYRSMVAVVLLCYLVPFLAYVPQFLSLTVKWRLDPSTNRSVAYIVPTSWFPAGRFHTLIPTYLNLLCQPLSFSTVVICSIITVIHLRRASQNRSQMTGKSNEESGAAENRLTVMLLFLCIVYAVVCLIHISSSIIHHVVPEFFIYRKYHNSFFIFQYVFRQISTCANSTVNFCAYLVLSSRFRKTLKEICPCFGLQ